MNRFDHHILRNLDKTPVILGEGLMSKVVEKLHETVPFLDDGIYVQSHPLYLTENLSILIVSVDQWHTAALCACASIFECIDQIIKEIDPKIGEDLCAQETSLQSECLPSGSSTLPSL